MTLPENLREDEVGELEKRCGHCREWWPADGEFFFPDKHGPTRLQSWCKACFAELRNARRAAERLEARKCAP